MDQYALVLYALVLWREAQNQNDATIRAIAWTIKNRVAKPRWWGMNLIGVLTKKWQYTSLTGTGDPNLIKWPEEGDGVFARCLRIASSTLSNIEGEIDPVKGATHYYSTDLKVLPEWVSALPWVCDIGPFKFFIEK